MDFEKTIHHMRKAYKACPKDYTCKPTIKAWLDFIESAHKLGIPVYIEQTGIMYRFFRNVAESENNGDLYNHCMAVSFAP